MSVSLGLGFFFIHSVHHIPARRARMKLGWTREREYKVMLSFTGKN